MFSLKIVILVIYSVLKMINRFLNRVFIKNFQDNTAV